MAWKIWKKIKKIPYKKYYAGLREGGKRAGGVLSGLNAQTKAYTSKMESPEQYNERMKKVFQ